MPETPIYKIIFFSMGQIYEVYARHIFQSDLYGFIEVEQLVFGERSQMLVELTSLSIQLHESTR